MQRSGKRSKEDIVRARRKNPKFFGGQQPNSLKIVDVKYYKVFEKRTALRFSGALAPHKSHNAWTIFIPITASISFV